MVDVVTELYLGTHEPRWIGRSSAPLFVSLTRADRFNRRAALGGWALDSGGFTQLQRGGWTMPAAEYLERVYALADRCAGMRWAAPQDWMCEPSALAATGLSVGEHQRRTVDNYAELAQLDERGLIIPVLQGWAPGEHERCAELYAAAGVNLAEAELVGVGTICRRQATAEIEGIVTRLAAGGLRLHGFGVKVTGLRRYAAALTSCDSLAWSFRGRSAGLHGEAPLCGGTHRSCANCYVWAHVWRERIVAELNGSSCSGVRRTLASVSSIGDTEPEDAYDASDWLEERLAVIVKILQARDADTDGRRRERRTAELLRLLGNIATELEGWRLYVSATIDRAEAG